MDELGFEICKHDDEDTYYLKRNGAPYRSYETKTTHLGLEAIKKTLERIKSGITRHPPSFTRQHRSEK